MRSAMCAASQLPGRGPTVVDMWITCTLIKNLMMVMMMMLSKLHRVLAILSAIGLKYYTMVL